MRSRRGRQGCHNHVSSVLQEENTDTTEGVAALRERDHDAPVASSLLGPDQEPVAVGAGLVQYETNAVLLQISRRHAEAFQIQPGAVEWSCSAAPFVLRNQNGTSARTRRCSATRYASTRSRVGRVTSPSVGRSRRLTAPSASTCSIGSIPAKRSRTAAKRIDASCGPALSTVTERQTRNANIPRPATAAATPHESARTFRDGTLSLNYCWPF